MAKRLKQSPHAEMIAWANGLRNDSPHVHHIFDTRLCCDGREYYHPCVLEGCSTRQYFCKHTSVLDRHCPRNNPEAIMGKDRTRTLHVEKVKR